jgi:hypothetical protein
VLDQYPKSVKCVLCQALHALHTRLKLPMIRYRCRTYRTYVRMLALADARASPRASPLASPLASASNALNLASGMASSAMAELFDTGTGNNTRLHARSHSRRHGAAHSPQHAPTLHAHHTRSHDRTSSIIPHRPHRVFVQTVKVCTSALERKEHNIFAVRAGKLERCCDITVPLQQEECKSPRQLRD